MAKILPLLDAGADNGPPVHPSPSAFSGTVSGPNQLPGVAAADMAVHELALQKEAIERTAQAMPFNENKADEHGLAHGHAPQQGPHDLPDDDTAGASTLSETVSSPKLGEDEPQLGLNANNDTLDRVRVDSSGQAITTNQGVPVADNQHSL